MQLTPTARDILLAVNREGAKLPPAVGLRPTTARLPVPQVGYLPVYDTACSLVVNVPLSRSNRCTEGCATQPLLLSSP